MVKLLAYCTMFNICVCTCWLSEWMLARFAHQSQSTTKTLWSSKLYCIVHIHTHWIRATTIMHERCELWVRLADHAILCIYKYMYRSLFLSRFFGLPIVFHPKFLSFPFICTSCGNGNDHNNAYDPFLIFFTQCSSIELCVHLLFFFFYYVIYRSLYAI